jgi:hypothetical protein
MERCIQTISEWIQGGKAYQIETGVGSFVCIQAETMNLTTHPVQYPILDSLRRHRDDFPIWAPYVDGNPSPFGTGLLTANWYLCVGARQQLMGS